MLSINSSPNAATVANKLKVRMMDIPDKDIGKPEVDVVLIIIIVVAFDVLITVAGLCF